MKNWSIKSFEEGQKKFYGKCYFSSLMKDRSMLRKIYGYVLEKLLFQSILFNRSRLNILEINKKTR